jgi:16S rRNA (adenine1518-N6/adenine1519-N6)-dimethyltransferase
MVRAKKSLGQNFLVDPMIQRRIVAALDAGPGDEVLEIGPGTGALTRHLAGEVRHLVAVELDDRLVAALRREYADEPSVEIHHANALDLDLADLSADVSALRVIGNIPYNITTPLIFWLLDRPVRPDRIVLMIQKEVADRILAAPGTKAYGALSVGVRTVANVERLFTVSRGAFNPVPAVDSAVIRITPLRPPPLEPREEGDLRTLTRTAFAWRRKQLQKILRSAPEYELDQPAMAQIEAETGIELRLRPEALSPDEFIRLSRGLRAEGFPRTTHQ